MQLLAWMLCSSLLLLGAHASVVSTTHFANIHWFVQSKSHDASEPASIRLRGGAGADVSGPTLVSKSWSNTSAEILKVKIDELKQSTAGEITSNHAFGRHVHTCLTVTWHDQQMANQIQPLYLKLGKSCQQI
jgi:hypothetical protein